MQTAISKFTIKFSLLSLVLAAFVFGSALLSGGPAQAQTGGNAKAARDLSCGTIKARLQRDGLIYLRTKTGKVERFVRDTKLCNTNRSVRYTTVRSKDKRYCTVTRCSSEDLLDDHSRGGRHGHGHGRGHGRGRY